MFSFSFVPKSVGDFASAYTSMEQICVFRSRMYISSLEDEDCRGGQRFGLVGGG